MDIASNDSFSTVASETLVKHPVCIEQDFRIFPLINSEVLLSSHLILINNYVMVVLGIIQ